MEKIKLFLANTIETETGKVILTILIVLLVGLGSFQLGRLSKTANTQSGIKIEYPTELKNTENQPANVLSATETTQNTSSAQKNLPNTNDSHSYFFASKRGHKYYPVGCSAGKSIKAENKIYFASRTEAEQAGYALSSSCK